MPPTTNKQLPPKVQIQAPQGSMLADAVPVSALQEDKVKVCIYGRNRVGKTTFAALFKKPLLFISSEPDANGGAQSVKSVPGVHLQRVSNKLLGQDKDGRWLNADDPRCVRKDKVKGCAKVVALANELKGQHPFATVVMDTATSLQDIALTELWGLPEVPDSMSWGVVPDGLYIPRAEKLRSTLRPLLDLTNCNVVILAQEIDHNAKEGPEDRGGSRKLMGGSMGTGPTMQQRAFMAPMLGSTNAKWLQDNVGYILQMYEDEIMEDMVIPQIDPTTGGAGTPIVQKVGTGKRQRHMRMLYHPNFAAGGRWDFDPSIPEFITAKTPKELYAALAEYIPALKT